MPQLDYSQGEKAMKIFSKLLIVVYFTFLPTVEASTIELKFSGILGSQLGTFGGNPFPGDTPFTNNMPFTLALTFDTQSTDITYNYTTPEGYSQTDYRAVSFVSIDVGGYKAYSQSGIIKINNQIETATSGVDAWSLVVEKTPDGIVAPTVAGLDLGWISISLQGPPTVFDSTSLIIPPFDELNKPLRGGNFALDYAVDGNVRGNPNSLVRGTITSMGIASPVPAPPAFILMLTGLGVLGLIKRFRKEV